MQEIQNAIIDAVYSALSFLGMAHAGAAGVIGTFIFLMAELVVLFIFISYLVALLQIYIPKETIQRALTTRSKWLNSLLGGLLGSVTPFCSCSTIPMLMGLIKSKAPFAGMMSFLLTSPILNPAIIVLFLTFFGVIPTVMYAGMAFTIAVVVGYILDIKGFDRYIKIGNIGNKGKEHPAPTSCCSPKAEAAPASSCCSTAPATSCCTPKSEPATSCCSSPPAASSSCCDAPEEIRYQDIEGSFFTRQLKASGYAMKDAVGLFNKVLFYLILGASIGAFIYGFIPADFLSQFAGANEIFSVPAAALLGIPMYIRTETMIPIADILTQKGVGLGTLVALIIGGAGASIPEVSLLSAIFKKQMVFIFVFCVIGIAITTGYLFSIFL